MSQLPVHNVYAIKHRPDVSYFSNWRSSFPVSIIYLDSFHFDNHVLILWVSTVVTRDPAVYSASEAEEGALKRINPR